MKIASIKFTIIFSTIIFLSAASSHSHGQVFKRVIDDTQDDKARTETSKKTTVRKRNRSTEYTYPTRRTNNLPPGQAKKIQGEQSARDFAPGHNKNKKKYHRKSEKYKYARVGERHKK